MPNQKSLHTNNKMERINNFCEYVQWKGNAICICINMHDFVHSTN